MNSQADTIRNRAIFADERMPRAATSPFHYHVITPGMRVRLSSLLDERSLAVTPALTDELAKFRESNLRDCILIGLHIRKKMIICLPQWRQDFYWATALLTKADIACRLGFNEEIADMRARDPETIGDRHE